jgi:hypothetical protein
MVSNPFLHLQKGNAMRRVSLRRFQGPVGGAVKTVYQLHKSCVGFGPVSKLDELSAAAELFENESARDDIQRALNLMPRICRLVKLNQQLTLASRPSLNVIESTRSPSSNSAILQSTASLIGRPILQFKP